METQTSFIPKQVLTRQTSQRSEGVGLFTVLSVVIFIVSLGFLGAVYFYRYILDDEINRPCPATPSAGADDVTRGCGLSPALAKKKADLGDETELLKRIERLDNKINKATALLAGHNSVLPIFEMLERLTLQTLGYTSFSFDGSTVKLAGKARSYESIALQSQKFSENMNEIKSFVFSGLSVGEDDTVSFQLTLTVDPQLTTYTKSLTL
ncbi:MAG: hypothetical protein AAB453_03620 [Patescibacteria group bacterium]